MEGPFLRVMNSSPLSQRSRSPLAFLDRDGVVNVGRAGYVNRTSEVELLEGSARAIAELKRHGFLVCIVTNQSALARGLWGGDQLVVIHDEIQAQLHAIDARATIDAYITCPHRVEDRCSCRKPSPAMLSLGHRVLREDSSSIKENELVNAGVQSYEVDWWGEKPTAPNPRDVMVGDRRTDMGAGWAYGARLFRVQGQVGLVQAIERIIDENEEGDVFQP